MCRIYDEEIIKAEDIKMSISNKDVEEITSNKFMLKMSDEFSKACAEGKSIEFLDANPDFVQMMLNYSKKVDVYYNGIKQ